MGKAKEALSLDYGIKSKVYAADKYIKWIANKIKFRNCKYYEKSDSCVTLYSKTNFKNLEDANKKEWITVIDNEFYEGVVSNKYEDIVKLFNDNQQNNNDCQIQLTLF